MNYNFVKRTLLLFIFGTQCCFAETGLFWWQPDHGDNFGDHLSQVIVERILGKQVCHATHLTEYKKLLAVGSVLHFARNGDIIWGSGVHGNSLSLNTFTSLDVRAVRGPRTRAFLLSKGIPCPEVYGDPALLMGHLFPEFRRKKPKYAYIIIPNIGEMECFKNYKNVVLPTLPWNEVVQKIVQSKLVIASSMHGVIVAEAFGIPARMLKMTCIEPLMKYQDYYESTGRPQFQYATSVREALEMGGETPPKFDIQPLLDAFPWDYFQADNSSEALSKY